MKREKIIGLRRKKVKLFSYNPTWKKLYKEEAKLLRSVIGKYVLDIQHVGSTSIPGAKAKPIIDIAIGVKNLKKGEKCIKPLKQLGYEYKHSAGIRGRHFFAKGSERNRTHYIHLVKLNGRFWKNCIIFRDSIQAIEEGKSYFTRVIVASLRLLICDYRAKDGLLTYFVEKYNFPEKVVQDSREVSIREYREAKVFQVGGSKEFSKSRCEVICNIAQQDGLAHEGLKRNYEHFLFIASLGMGKTKKTDPLKGIILSWGVQIFNFGNQFCEYLENKYGQQTAQS